MRIDVEHIIKEFTYKAKSILGDKERLNAVFSKAREMIKENKELNEIVEEIKLFIDLVRDYVNGNYRELATSSIVLVTAGLVYLVTPIDLIPDFMFGGFLDDVAVIAYIIKKIQTEIDEYKVWRGNKAAGVNDEEYDSEKNNTQESESFYEDFNNDDNLIEISLDDDDVEEI